MKRLAFIQKSIIHLVIILGSSAFLNNSFSQSVIHPYGNFCVGQINVFAYTGPGSVTYWSVGGGGTIISNSGGSIQVVWNSSVTAWVDAYYTSYNGSGVASYTVNISASVTPSVTIGVNQNNICQGTSVTFTATPVNGGANPTYSWYVDGSYITSGYSNSFTTSSLTNGQQVTCVMYTSVACYTSYSATSNAVTMTVNTPQTMTVTISGNTSICQGSGAGFSATVTNGVGSLTYQWKKNGNNISSDAQGVPVYALSLNSVSNGDIITCVVTSNGCANPATSNSLTISIVSPQNFTISPSVSVLGYCSGGSVNFTASSSHSAYNYQWYMNGTTVSGANSSTFTTTAISLAQLQSVTVSAYANASCVNNTYASGSAQNIPFIIYSSPSVTGNFSVTAGSSTTLTATGNTPNFRWYDATGTQIYQGSQYATPTTITPGIYIYQVRGVNTDGTCLTDPVSVTVTVNFPIVTYTDPYNSSNFIKTVDLTKPVGTVSGAASTTPTGGVTYSIPIYAPPGTNGIQPSIGIVYNSQSGNGLAGYGWNISGLSAIGRAGKNIYFNGVVAPVSYTADDAFTFDGMKLNAISGSNGANGTIYATEAETFSKIISFSSTSPDNPDWFQVIVKDGSVMEFGHTSDSRILTDNGGGVMFWRLNKIIDVNGNYMEFKYENGFRDSRIVEINYTGNAVAGLSPYNKIKFNYQGRTDMNTIYNAGASITSKSLLTSITVIHDGLLVKTYQFNYGFDNINSLLKEVVEAGKDGSSLNSTIFLYGDSPINFSSEPTPAVAGSAVYQIGDFNADGLSDIMEFFPASSNFSCRIYGRSSASSPLQLKYDGSPSGFGSGQYQIISKNTYLNSSYNQILSASSDFKGDGKEDFLITNSYVISSSVKALSGIYVLTSYDDLTGFYLFGPGSQLPVGYDGNTYTNCSRFGPSSNYIVSGDFDGDGTTDIITFLQNDNGNYFSHFTSTHLNITHAQINPVGLSVSSVANAAGGVQSIDFDGDGKMELLVIADDRSYVLSLKAEQGSYTSYRWDKIYETYSVNKDSKIFYGDFNGDRKTDLLVRNGSSWLTLLGTGLSFIGNTFTFNQNVILNGANGDHKIIVSDFNGDGKSDILHMYNDPSGKLSIYYSKDMGGVPGFYYEQYPYNKLVGNPNVVAGDLNGDGRGDLITAVAYGEPYDILYIKPNGKERLLSKVTDGHNVTATFEYKSLTDKSTFPYFYDRTVLLDDQANQNPYNYIQPPIYAVSSLIVPNGIGGTTTTSFNYENAIMHRAGKGFLGFKKITAKNSTTGTTTVSESEINGQFASCYATRQSSLVTATSELLSESQITSTFTNLSTGPNDKRYLQKTDKVLNIDYLLGNASELVNNYDNYGNITNATLKTGTLSGNTVDALATVVTTANYSIHNTPVPAKPDNITILKTRTGMSSVTSTTSFLYTSTGLVSSKTEFVGLPKAVTTVYGYNSFGNNTSVTLSAIGLNNRVTNFTYDPSGRFLASKQLTGNGVSQTEFLGFDAAWGKPISQTSSDCLTTTFEYDVFGRLKKTNLPAGYSINTSLMWDIQGERVFYSFTDYPGGNADAKVWFDKLGRETKKQTLSFNNQWLTQITTYDGIGNIASNTNTYFSNETPLTTTNTYDAYHRLQSTTNGLSTTSYSYTKLAGGKMQVVTQNSAGQSTTRISDATGKLVSTLDNGGQMDFTFDCWGNQTQVNHGSTVLITSTFDSYGRQTGLTDKNAGAVTYEYDAYGQLKQQTDANSNSYIMTYDDLGRLISRQGSEGTTTYEYYKNTSTGCSNNNLAKVTGFNGVIKENTYNALMRLQSEKVTIDGADYITQYVYDTYGQLINTTYPSGVVVNNIYDANGGLVTVTGGNAGSPNTLFNATGVNGLGQYTSYTLGNGKTSQNTFNYGIPARYYTQGVQDLNLNFDYATGNLLSRSDVLKNITESFNYDNLNRVTASIVNGVQQLGLSYDGNTSFSMGNIVSKTDAGNYVYKNDKVHAVAYITNPVGAQSPPTNISTSQQIISYTPFLKTASITEDIYQLDFTYGPDYQRIKSVLKQNSIIAETKYYLGNYEKQVNGSGTREINYVTGGNGLCAIIVRENGVNNFYFVYTDHLGSILSVTDINGNIIAEQNFDTWGRKRNPVNLQYSSVPTVPGWLYRGYTSHEHLPQFSLINMNGRMYDPIQGRMLSPDNYVSYPLWSQAYNRYTYAGNNPLIYTDPDGNWFGIDDIIVSSVGFVMGYVSYGITKGNWGGKALLTGLTSAVVSEASYLTLGGGLMGSTTARMGGAGSLSAAKSFAGSYAFSQAQTVGLNYDQIHNSSDWRAFGLLSAYSFFSAAQAGFNSEYMEKKVDKWLWADSKDYRSYLSDNRGENSNELGGLISVLGKEEFKRYDPSSNTWTRENGSIFGKTFFYGIGTAWAGRSAATDGMAEGVYKADWHSTFLNFSCQTVYNTIFNLFVFKGKTASEYPEYNSNLLNLLLR